jgi:uncharacterized YigZ family protein
MSVLLATPVAEARWEIEVRKSRFVALAASVATPEQALAFVDSRSDRSATHNCWAYRIGQQYRFNDDGEPAGTAGKPILQAIDAQRFDAVVVVVTRWFGGIKLGAGGLARAYGGCAAECLRGAARRDLVARKTVEFEVPFALLPVLRARFDGFGAIAEHEAFVEHGARMRLSLPAENLPALDATLADLSRGRCRVRVVD